MSDDPRELPESGALQRASAEQSEVFLRNRDVQALSRSFRRLSEVQEALLEHLDGIEESRSRRWVLPLLAISCLVLGGGLATFGLLWYQDQREQVPLQVRLDELPEPQVTVAPPQVTVQAPESALDAETMRELVRQLQRLGEAQAADRALIGELTGRLVDGEMGMMRLLEEMQAADRIEAAAASSRVDRPAQPEPASSTGPAVAGVPASPPIADEPAPEEAWLGALNGLLAMDGRPDLLFRKASRLAGQPELREVLFLTWGSDGLIDSVIRAERAVFRLQQASYTLEIQFLDGTRTRGAAKTALTGGGLRVVVEEVDVVAWLEHFPELAHGAAARPRPESPPAADPGAAAATSAAPEAVSAATNDGAEADPLVEPTSEAGPSPVAPESAPTPWAAERAEAMRLKVDELLRVERAFGHYRLQRVGTVRGTQLEQVRLAWYDAAGRLVQYVEADRLEVASRGEGWLELRFHEGSFRREDRKSPFQGGVYRLHLPDQDLAAWRATGVPILDAAR